MKNLTAGNPYEIHCEVSTNPIVHSDIVNITWIGPSNESIVTDNRVNVTTTIFDGNNHTSILKFMPLTDKDKGLYICKITILNNTDSQAFIIGDVSSKLCSLLVIVCNVLMRYNYVLYYCTLYSSSP